MLRTVDLIVRYDQEIALRGVTVNIEAGEVVGIIGASGSGKSTLLLCLAGLQKPTQGDVQLDGRSFSGLSDNEMSCLRRTRLGVMMQFGELVPELDLRENVSLPLRFQGQRRRAAEAAADRALHDLDIADLGHRRPAEVSGGQLQRAALARALVSEPDVILADEPTGALDSRTGEMVIQLLMREVRRRRCALVLVTHDLAVAKRADRTVTLIDGAVLAT